jgi:hypothetical protein
MGRSSEFAVVVFNGNLFGLSVIAPEEQEQRAGE